MKQTCRVLGLKIWKRRSKRDLQSPYLTPLTPCSSVACLLSAFLHWLYPTQVEHAHVRAICRCLGTIFCSTPYAPPIDSVRLFGSFATGLALFDRLILLRDLLNAECSRLSHSHFDLCIMCEGDGYNNINLGVDRLRALADGLRPFAEVSNPKSAYLATVPIIRFKIFGYDVGVSVGSASFRITADWYGGQMQAHPFARDVLVIIKTMLRVQGLMVTSSGGISSAVIFCLIVAFMEVNQADSRSRHNFAADLLLANGSPRRQHIIYLATDSGIHSLVPRFPFCNSYHHSQRQIAPLY